MDKETNATIREGEELRNLVGGTGWMVAQKMLSDMMAVIEKVETIPDDLSLEATAIETMARRRTIAFVNAWREAIENRIAIYEKYLQNVSAKEESDPILINRE